jgi:hypothetical protein
MPSDTHQDERQSLLSQDEKHDYTTITHESRILLQYSVPLAAINFLRYVRPVLA